MQYRIKGFVFEIEKVMRIVGCSGRQDQKLPRPHLPPQEIAAPIRSVRKEGPDQRMSGTEPSARFFRYQDASERVRGTVAAQPSANEHWCTG